PLRPAPRDVGLLPEPPARAARDDQGRPPLLPAVGAAMPTVFPGFTLPDELRVLREQIRRFIREEIIPLEQRLDPDAPGIPDEDSERLSAKTKAAGLWALGAPEQYGGGGLDTFSMSVVLEE